jgi:hypothetical protein
MQVENGDVAFASVTFDGAQNDWIDGRYDQNESVWLKGIFTSDP